ncbi:MAG: L-threonylcarbamoyladenylate synthase [Acidimicrobiales bacterium]
MSRIGSVEEAVEALRAGQVVAFATDTVYGIATDPSLAGAAEKLARAKGRSQQVPLQVLISGMDQAEKLGVWTEAALRVAETLWPGALTVVVERKPGAVLHIGGDDHTVGLRWPDNPVSVELCQMCGPLAATSANRHGEPPLTTAEEVAQAFDGSVAVVVDGGHLPGSASTVVDLTGDKPVVLREGGVPASAIEAAFA